MKKYDWSNVVDDYKRLGTIKAVAEKYGSCNMVVSKALKDNGYKVSHENKGIDTTSGLGRVGELLALELLPGSIDVNQQTNVNAPTDLIWNDNKINVKVSRLRSSFSRGNEFPNIKWSFKIFNNSYARDERLESDFHFCIGLDENDFVEKMFLVPSSVLPKHLTIGRKTSKYDKYSFESTREEIQALKYKVKIDIADGNSQG